MTTTPPSSSNSAPSLDELPGYGCDWGFCSDDAVAWRWAEDFDDWLPVCSAHTTAPPNSNPYCHDHNPLNADFHGGICPACEWESDQALACTSPTPEDQ